MSLVLPVFARVLRQHAAQGHVAATLRLVADGVFLDGPGHADDGLLVTHRNIAPGEDQEQLAVTPQIAPVVLLGAAGFEDKQRLVRN